MRKFLIASFQFIALHFLFGQIPNAGFEFWDNQPVPLLWETNSRPITCPPYDPYIVRQDTERYAGNFAANFWANGFFKAYATTTFPVSIHPLNLSLYYKLSFAPCVNDIGFPQKDTVSVLVELLNGNVVVDSGYWESITTSFSYSQLIIPISQNATVFDSCRITIRGGKVFGGCGIVAAPTEFKVDQLELHYPPACTNTGIVVDGVEAGCLLIYTGSANLLLPCNVSLSFLGFIAGDTIHFSFIQHSCITTCQQGTTVNITCIDTSAGAICNTSVSLTMHPPTSYVATNGSIRAVVTEATPPLFFLWSNGINGYSIDSIGDLGEGNYCATVSDVNNCTASICDSLAGPHICIDSALICEPGSLCCDAPLVDPVCGCDGVTYTNGCIAALWNGITSYTQGACGDSCNASFYFIKHIDTVTFYNTSTASAPIGMSLWHLGDGTLYQGHSPTYIYPHDSTYIVCLAITTFSGCRDTICDTVLITHNCIDSTLLCGFPLCCDFVPHIPVCGCDSVTYNNACEAEGFYGVASYYTGACLITATKSISETEKGIFVFPVPAKDKLNVVYEMRKSGNTEIRITNMLGQTMKSHHPGFETSGQHIIEIEMPDYFSGIYFAEVKNEFERKLKKFAVSP